MKRSKKNYLFLGLMLVMILICTIACNKSSSPRQPSAPIPAELLTGTPGANAAVEAAKKIFDETGKPVPLEFWHSRSEEPYQEYFRAYEKKNPYITINMSYMNDNDYKTQSRVNLAAGNLPDVWWTNTGASLAQWVDAGGFIDLTPYESKFDWRTRYIGSAQNDMTYNGKLYGLPFDGIAFWATLYVNKTFFEENNLQYPVTADDMIALAPKLRALGQEPMTFYNLDGWYADLFFADFLLQMEDDTFVAKKNSGESKWSGDKSVIAALTKVKQMVDAGCMTTGFETMRQDTVLPLFRDKRTPIMYNGTWFGGNIGTDWDFEAEAIPMFQITPGSKHKAYMSKVNWAMGVSPASKIPDIAVGFVDYLTNKDFYGVMTGIATGMFSPIVGHNDELTFPSYFSGDAIQDQLKPDAKGVDYFHYAFSFDVCAAMRDQIKMILAGQISIDDALANWDAITADVLAATK